MNPVLNESNDDYTFRKSTLYSNSMIEYGNNSSKLSDYTLIESVFGTEHDHIYLRINQEKYHEFTKQ